ncbi:Hypothetical protein GLP15_1151 [Giardia lamblia P15]|uniref:Uncharacterized protein n=1 Tax=Giardia intestinalis (strain P15) TaxID=658858 RepID=E1F4R0_GIAIA|nr:Hypothetical protein GLP15_1151 [Giardia lamblia P15]
MSWNKADLSRVKQFARDEEDLRRLMEMTVVDREVEIERRHNSQVWGSAKPYSTTQHFNPTQIDLGLGDDDNALKESSESFVVEDENEESEQFTNFVTQEPIEPQITAKCYQNVILPAQFLVMYSPQWFFEEVIRKHAMFLLRLNKLGADVLPQYSRNILIPVRVSPDMWQSDANSFGEVYQESREHIYDSYLANPEISRYYVEILFPEELQKENLRVSCADLIQDEEQYNEKIEASSLFTDAMLRELMNVSQCPYRAVTYRELMESGLAIKAIMQAVIGAKPEREYVSRLIQFENYIIKALSPFPNIKINQIHMRIDAINDSEKQILLCHHVKIEDLTQDELEARYSEGSRRHLRQLREELLRCEDAYRKSLTAKKEISYSLYNTSTGTQSSLEFMCFNPAGSLQQLWQKAYKELLASHAKPQYAEKLATLKAHLKLDKSASVQTQLGKTLLMAEAIDTLALNSAINITDGFFTIEDHRDLGPWPLLGPQYRVDILGSCTEATRDSKRNGVFYFCHRYVEDGCTVLKFATKPVPYPSASPI